MRYVVAAKVKDVKPGRIKGVRLRGGHELAIANVGGRFYAFQAYCPHNGWPLTWGAIDDGAVVCALHLWRFDPATGEAIDPPQVDCLEVYPIKVDGDQVMVGLPD